MTSWFAKLPNFNFFRNAKIQSNCCNKIEDSDKEIIKCIFCRGSGKLLNKHVRHIYEKDIFDQDIFNDVVYGKSLSEKVYSNTDEKS